MGKYFRRLVSLAFGLTTNLGEGKTVLPLKVVLRLKTWPCVTSCSGEWLSNIFEQMAFLLLIIISFLLWIEFPWLKNPANILCDIRKHWTVVSYLLGLITIVYHDLPIGDQTISIFWFKGSKRRLLWPIHIFLSFGVFFFMSAVRCASSAFLSHKWFWISLKCFYTTLWNSLCYFIIPCFS